MLPNGRRWWNIGWTEPALRRPKCGYPARETRVSGLLGELTPVLMAKWPDAGQVKTRLTRDAVYSPDEAARIAEAMLRCMAERLAAAGALVLAVTPQGCGERLARRLGVRPARLLNQAPGNLGRRLDRVWSAVGDRQPVAFFGGDSPDIPDSMLQEIPAAHGGGARA